MKFPTLPIGDAFEWNGATWRKTSPLAAVCLSGAGPSEGRHEPRLIPRSALVRPLAAGADPVSTVPARDPIDAALAAFEAGCLALVDEWRQAGLPEEEALRAALAGLRAKVLVQGRGAS